VVGTAAGSVTPSSWSPKKYNPITAQQAQAAQSAASAATVGITNFELGFCMGRILLEEKIRQSGITSPDCNTRSSETL
jgi:hypothetical protein